MTATGVQLDGRPEWPVPGMTVVIAGLGLLGASLGLALRAACPTLRILGYARQQSTVDAAVAAGMVHAGSVDPAAVLPQADVTVICIPVSDTIAFALAHAALWRPGAVVTDVGSTKQTVVEAVRPALLSRGVQFVGSHPMAGSEKSGLEHADAALYRGATVFLTPQAGDAPAAVAALEALWHAVGARTVALAADRHDRLVAHTSQVLHLVAAATVPAVLQDELALHGTAGGFRDFTRIASGSPEMWAQIFQENREPLLAALDDLESELQRYRALLATNDWPGVQAALAKARDQRDGWLAAWTELRRDV